MAHDPLQLHPSSSSSYNTSSPFGSPTSVTHTSSTLHHIFNNTLKLTSWNGRAVFASNPRWRRPKHDLLWKLIFSTDVLLLQEVHGSESDLLLFLSRLQSTHFILYSFTDRRDTGGVVIIVRKSSFPNFFVEDSQVLVPGRVLVVTLKHASGCIFKIGNMHYYQFTSEQFRAVSDYLSTDIQAAHAHPLTFFSVIGGDFNIHRDDSIKFNLASPVSPPCSPPRPSQ